MGGQNHQPCGKFLDLSTKLSKLVSMVTINMQAANVALEDVLLAELDTNQESMSLGLSITFLDKAKDDLRSALKTSIALRNRMEKLEYIDLHPLHNLDLSKIGDILSTQNIVEQNSWDKMSSIMQNGTFYANLDLFDKAFETSLALVSDLAKLFEELEYRQGTINLLVEKNQSGNFKKAFAKMLTHWLRFQQDFLASSLLSTEVYYSSITAGSLCDYQEVLVVNE